MKRMLIIDGAATAVGIAALHRTSQQCTLHILLRHGSTLSKEDQQHILRISNNNQELLDELMAVHDK